MDNQEYNKCIEILRGRPKWFFQKDNIDQKLKCLETFKNKGTPSDISFLVEFLKDSNSNIRAKSAETIIHLYQQLKSQNELYESLKYIKIDIADINHYKMFFVPDTYLQLLGIASLNQNGYTREKAIKKLADSKNPNAIKFILLRLGDWVTAVRETAQKTIRTFFTPPYIDSFLQQLPLIDWLLRVQRTDLADIHSEIIEFALSPELTVDFYKKLKRFDDKTRFIYFRNFLKSKRLNEEIAELISKDKNYLVRVELLKHIQNLATSKRKELITQFLQDRSARVRVNALYETKALKPEFDSITRDLASDESSSVRDLARYLLKDDAINFAAVYRQQLSKNEKLAGSILGLSEVGTKDDLALFESHMLNEAPKIKIACLNAIHRIDPTISQKYSLEFLSHPIKRVRNKSVEILSSNSGHEVLEKARVVYRNGDYEQKKTILKLFNQVGGWAILGDILISLTDSNEDIQNLGWMFLQKWKDKAVSLFITPTIEDIKRANEIYNQIDKAKTKLTYHREQLWNVLPFFLRR